MAKILGTKSGTCTVCGINCWEETNSEPSIWPCGVNACPYETQEQQASIGLKYERSQTGTSLQLPIFEG